MDDGPNSVGDTRPRRRRRAHRSWGQRAVIGLGGVCSMALVVGAVVVGYVNWRYGQIRRVDVDLQETKAGAPQNFLIAGSDSRAKVTENSANAGAFLNGQYDAGQRSDSIMILRVDPKSTKAQLLSIPRDLWVPIAGKGYSAKVNAAFAASPQTLITTLEQYLGIPINHYLDVDFEGFQKLVDAIGGVSIYFDTPMRDRHTGLDVEQPGCVKLDGESALAFARSRYLQYYDAKRGIWVSDDASDFGRIKRQQFLIRHAIQRVDQQGLLTSPGRLNGLADAFVKTVAVDKTFGLRDLLDLAGQFKKFDAQHLESYTIPIDEYWVDGQDALKMRDVEAQPILNKFRGAGRQATERSVSLKVYNGTGVDHQAANVAGAFDRIGFNVAGIGTAGDIGLAEPPHTEVLYGSAGDQASAELVARHLTSGASLMQSAAIPAGTVYVVTAPDFTTVEASAKPASAGNATAASAGAVATSAPSTSVPSSAPSTAATTTSSTVAGKVPPDKPPRGVSCG